MPVIFSSWDPYGLTLCSPTDSSKQPIYSGHLQGDLSRSVRGPDRRPLPVPQHAHLWPAVLWGAEPGRAAPRRNLLPVSLSEPIREEEEPGAGSGVSGCPEEQPPSGPESGRSPGGGGGLRRQSRRKRSALRWTERARSAAPLGGLRHFPALTLWLAEGGAASRQRSRAVHPEQRALRDSSCGGHVLLLPCYRGELRGAPGKRGRWGDGLPVRAHGGSLLRGYAEAGEGAAAPQGHGTSWEKEGTR